MPSGSAYDQFDDKRVRHLELVQSVVARLSNESFVVKGWAITVGAALIGFAISVDSAGLAFAAILPSLLFWALDTYFLRSERLFRSLYDSVRAEEDIEAFYMSATSPWYVNRVARKSNGQSIGSWWRTL